MAANNLLIEPLSAALLPNGIRSRHLEHVNGLRMHVLEAGDPQAPCVLLLHGFPELAYSWRKVMPAIAEAGYYVVAPDQRGYGRTTGWEGGYDVDLSPYRFLNLVRDALALLWRLGREHVDCVVGHDFGSPVAAWSAVSRPDVFRSVVLMSAPFGGTPATGAGSNARASATSSAPTLDAQLAGLPRPRKHYHNYYSTRDADADMLHCPQGVHDFLRAYFHHKSADWPGNTPHALAEMSGTELAALPTYYVMNRDETMPQTVAPHMPDAAAIAACRWMPDAEMAVFAQEYARATFQGGLNWYRSRVEPAESAELRLFAGRTIDVPSGFVAGTSDWGVRQSAGMFEAMQTRACTRMTMCELLPGAGHWVQQEQAQVTAELLQGFLREHKQR